MTSNPAHPGRPELRRLRVLLAGQPPAVRDGLTEEFRRLQFVEVVGEANKHHEALDLFFRVRPDVVLLSVCLSDQSGFELLRCIKQAAPGCAAILTTRWPNSFVEETGAWLGAAAVCPIAGGFAQLRGLLQGLWDSQSAREV